MKSSVDAASRRVSVFWSCVVSWLMWCAAGAMLVGCQTWSTHNLMQQGDRLAVEGLYREAQVQYEQALKRDPQHTLAHRNLGIVLVHIGLYRRAHKHLSLAYKDFPKDYQTNFYLAETYRVFRSFGPAVHHYNVCLLLRNRDLRASRGLAWAYYHSKDYNQALQVLSSVSEGLSKSEDTQVAIIRARIHLQLKNYGAAAALMLRQTRQAPQVYLPFVLALMGDIYLKRQNIPRAKEHYQKALALTPHLPSALLGQAKIAYAAGEWKKAADLLKQALGIKKDLMEAYLYLGRIFKHVDPAKSLAYYRTFAGKMSGEQVTPSTAEEVRSSVLQLKKQLAEGGSAPTGKVLAESQAPLLPEEIMGP